MMYKLLKLVNGNLHISDAITLTDELPFITIDESQIKYIQSFDMYRKDNPFCRVLEIKEDVKNLKKSKK